MRSWENRYYQMKYDEPGARYIWEAMEWRTSNPFFPAARRDPIFTPLFTSLFTALGFSASTTALLAAGATAIVTTAISIGIQMLLAPKPPKPEDGKVPKVQSIPYRQWSVGRNRLGGAFMLWEAKGNKLYSVQALCGHLIKSINRFWLHDDEVTVGPDGTIEPGTTYGIRVQLFHRLGLVPETPYSTLVSALSSTGIWTNNHRGDGQASVAMICRAEDAQSQNKRFPYGPPQLSCEVDGALCWDFRDPLQDPEDPSTWAWTRNSALIMAWHQCFNEFGHRRDYRRAILPVLDMWQEEADVCDELVALNGGGFERRYECNGFDTTENDPKAATNAILASCDGWICERGDGALLFIVGKFREKYVTTLTDADIVGRQIEYGVLFEDECNRLIPTFNYPEIGYGTSDTDFFEDTAAQITAGRVLAQEANYQWVQQWRQARRLGKRDWLRLQEKVSGQINVRLSGINSVYSRWVRINAPIMLPKLNGKLVENRKSVLSLLQGGFTMDIMKHPDNIDAWNPTTDEGQMPPVPPKVDPDEIETPVINLVQAKPNGESVYIRVVIIDPEDDSLIPVVRYRVADDGAGNPGAWVEQEFPNATPSGGFIDLNTNVVPSNKLLDIQVAFIASDKDYGDWSVTANVTSTVDPVAPQSLSAFSAGSGQHLGNVPLSVTTKNDARVRRVDIYRVPTGAAFSPTAETPVTTLAVGASITYSFTDGDDTRANLVTNGTFASDTAWTKGTGWTISAGAAHKASGIASLLQQVISALSGAPSSTFRGYYEISNYSAGSTRMRLDGGTTSNGVLRSANGSFLETLVNNGNTTLSLSSTATLVCDVDNVVLYRETASCAPQGVWDYYAVPRNGSNVAGPTAGPVTVTII